MVSFNVHLEKRYYYPDGGSFNDDVGVEGIHWHRIVWNLG